MTNDSLIKYIKAADGNLPSSFVVDGDQLDKMNDDQLFQVYRATIATRAVRIVLFKELQVRARNAKIPCEKFFEDHGLKYHTEWTFVDRDEKRLEEELHPGIKDKDGDELPTVGTPLLVKSSGRIGTVQEVPVQEDGKMQEVVLKYTDDKKEEDSVVLNDTKPLQTHELSADIIYLNKNSGQTYRFQNGSLVKCVVPKAPKPPKVTAPKLKKADKATVAKVTKKKDAPLPKTTATKKQAVAEDKKKIAAAHEKAATTKRKKHAAVPPRRETVACLRMQAHE